VCRRLLYGSSPPATGDDGRAFCRVDPVQHAPVAIPDGDDCIGLACNLDQERRNVFPTTIDRAYHAVGLLRPFDGEGCHCLCRCAALVQAYSGPSAEWDGTQSDRRSQKGHSHCNPSGLKTLSRTNGFAEVSGNNQEAHSFFIDRGVSAVPVCFHGDSAGAEVKLHELAMEVEVNVKTEPAANQK
jgi:hypothetical protein